MMRAKPIPNNCKIIIFYLFIIYYKIDKILTNENFMI